MSMCYNQFQSHADIGNLPYLHQLSEYAVGNNLDDRPSTLMKKIIEKEIEKSERNRHKNCGKQQERTGETTSSPQ